jgi:hypothetical protein
VTILGHTPTHSDASLGRHLSMVGKTCPAGGVRLCTLLIDALAGRDHPGLGFGRIEKRVEADFRTREEKLKAAAAKGRYDLS